MKYISKIVYVILITGICFALIAKGPAVQQSKGQCVPTPATPSICIVTTDSATGKNLIVWTKDTVDATLSYYKIWKEGTAFNDFSVIDSVSVFQESFYVDLSSSPAVKSNRYKISVVDTCGNESDTSLAHMTLKLSANISPDLANVNLLWNHYEGFSFSSYYLYRGSASGGITAFDTVVSSDASYTDLNVPVTDSLFYFIEIKHPDGCIASKTKNYSSSKSNTAQTLSPTASPDVAFSADNVSIIEAGSVTFTDATTNTISSGGTVPTYSWTFTGGNPSVSNSKTPPAVSYSAQGCYGVTLVVKNTNTGGGSDSLTKSCYIDVGPTVIPEITEKFYGLGIYPNPSKEKTEISYMLASVSQVELTIYNVLGKKEKTLVSSRQPAGKYIYYFSSPDNGLRPGVYMVKLNVNGRIYTDRYIQLQ